MTEIAVSAPHPTTTARSHSRDTTRGALAAALCGMALLWVVGFVEVETIHNIAHDTRHSALFPCH